MSTINKIEDVNHITLATIVSTKEELAQLRKTGSKQEQLECFKRLVQLYGALNLEKLLNETQGDK